MDNNAWAEINRLRAKVAKLETRLEIDREYELAEDGVTFRAIEIPKERRDTEIDGIECRDRTIKLQDERITELTKENWQLKQALGYPIPSGFDTPQNPFKCGSCDARATPSQGGEK